MTKNDNQFVEILNTIRNADINIEILKSKQKYDKDDNLLDKHHVYP